MQVGYPQIIIVNPKIQNIIGCSDGIAVTIHPSDTIRRRTSCNGYSAYGANTASAGGGGDNRYCAQLRLSKPGYVDSIPGHASGNIPYLNPVIASITYRDGLNCITGIPKIRVEQSGIQCYLFSFAHGQFIRQCRFGQVGNMDNSCCLTGSSTRENNRSGDRLITSLCKYMKRI